MSEGQHLEWKSFRHDDHLKAACAFANADGGALEIGRDDEGEVIGIGARARRGLPEELPNELHDPLGVVVAIARFSKPAPWASERGGSAHVEVVAK